MGLRVCAQPTSRQAVCRAGEFISWTEPGAKFVHSSFTSHKTGMPHKHPRTLWHEIAPDEYDFCSNANPQVNYPRWSQAYQRRINSSALAKTMPTLTFYGCADQVAGLYSGMDLKNYY